MSWQLRLTVGDAGDGPVPGALLRMTTRAGTGNFDVRPTTVIGADVDLLVPDTTENVVVSLAHPRFAPLVVMLVHGPGETGWRWTEAALRVTTQGGRVTVGAVLSRMRLAPLTTAGEVDLVRRAEQVKARVDAAARRLPVPFGVRTDGLPGMLRDREFYRNSGAPDGRAFHILAAEPLGDARRADWPVTAPSWNRFATTVRAVSPGRSGRIYLLEYGEVGPGKAGPRFLVTVWLPHQFARVGCPSIDFLVWFTPSTDPPVYPRVGYPYGRDYPYVLVARGDGSHQDPYRVNQSYAEVGFGHPFGAHKLVYQLLAAQRSAAIVVPVASSSHFELSESPVALMWMLKEVCRAVPRDEDGRTAKRYPDPPAVGRVGAASHQLGALLGGAGAAVHHLDSLYTVPPPPPGFQLVGFARLDFHGADVTYTVDAPDLLPNPNPTANSFTIRLTYANFGGRESLPFDVAVTYEPTTETKKRIDDQNTAAKTAYDDQVAIKKEQLFYETLRARLKLVGKVVSWPQDDLREEERNVVYRSVIARLYGSEGGWSREGFHVATELIRFLFDVDSMLYFVAPDWWRPRAQRLVSKDAQGKLQPTIIADEAVSDRVVHIGKDFPIVIPGHRPYYLITEETQPAPGGPRSAGSSSSTATCTATPS